MRGAKKPTAAELEHMGRCRDGPCIPCIVRLRAGHLSEDEVFVGVSYDHKKSGNIRRGHLYGFASCAWHHFGHPLPAHLPGPNTYGPSLMDGSRLFRETYGSDDELIELQRRILEGEPWEG